MSFDSLTAHNRILLSDHVMGGVIVSGLLIGCGMRAGPLSLLLLAVALLTSTQDLAAAVISTHDRMRAFRVNLV